VTRCVSPALETSFDWWNEGRRGAHHITDLVRLCHHRCDELRLSGACLRIFLGRHDGFTVVVQSYTLDVTAHLAFTSALEWR
jgi:hypothetical protein